MDGLSALSDSLASVIEKIGAGVVGVEGRGSRGTGIAWSSDGLVVTAEHVVRNEDGVRVRLADGATVDADLVGRDPTTDVALLRARGAALVAPSWAEPASLRVGNLVLALGRPGQELDSHPEFGIHELDFSFRLCGVIGGAEQQLDAGLRRKWRLRPQEASTRADRDERAAVGRIVFLA